MLFRTSCQDGVTNARRRPEFHRVADADSMSIVVDISETSTTIQEKTILLTQLGGTPHCKLFPATSPRLTVAETGHPTSAISYQCPRLQTRVGKGAEPAPYTTQCAPMGHGAVITSVVKGASLVTYHA